MKETIYTIPINEAMDEKSPCPLCILKKRLESSEVEYTVGPAMMEEDFRELTDKYGFCRRHLRELNSCSKALPLALIFDTHFKEIEKILNTDITEKKGVFKKGESGSEKFVKNMKRATRSCLICTRIEETFDRYVDNFVYLMRKDKDFLNKVLESDGFCMEHFSVLAEKAREKMSPKEFEAKFLPVIKLQKEKVEKFHTYIKNFIKKFDYRNAGKPLEAPSDILIQTSFFLCGEFEQKEKNLKNV